MINTQMRSFKFFLRKESILRYCTQKEWQQPNGYDTNIKIYNPVVKDFVKLITKEKKLMTWYSCGPTVYDSAHIGHASSYMQIDLIRRILEIFYDINIVTVMGITDIDDKLIVRAKEMGIDVNILAKKFENEFQEDMASLNIKSPDLYARVTDHLDDIIRFVDRIKQAGYGYKTSDGTINFSVNKLNSYGKLVSAQEEGEAIDKESSRDFAMWKGAKKGEPFWESPWGPGRPGWHIECSTMASKYLGQNIDVHSGGIDLKFPHHENEEAQSCAHHNIGQWVNYWIHTGHLNVDSGVKMSKSLKNFITIREFLNDYSADNMRMMCLLVPYRNPINYSDELMQNVISIERKIQDFLNECKLYIDGDKPNCSINESLLLKELFECKENILREFSEDFDTPSAMRHLNKLISVTNSALNAKAESSETRSYAVLAIASYIKDFLEKLGFESLMGNVAGNEVEKILESSVNFRTDIRTTALKLNRKNNELHEVKKELLKVCDNFRDDLLAQGIELKDSNNTTSWVIRSQLKTNKNPN